MEGSRKASQEVAFSAGMLGTRRCSPKIGRGTGRGKAKKKVKAWAGATEQEPGHVQRTEVSLACWSRGSRERERKKMRLDKVAGAKSWGALQGMLRSLDVILEHWKSQRGFESFTSICMLLSNFAATRKVFQIVRGSEATLSELFTWAPTPILLLSFLALHWP